MEKNEYNKEAKGRKTLANIRKKGYTESKMMHNLCAYAGRSVSYVFRVYRCGT